MNPASQSTVSNSAWLMDDLTASILPAAAEEIDLYEVLNIERSASKDDVRKAYRKAALQHHPDKVAEDQREQAEVKFKSVSQAYEILYDDEKREVYDRCGMSGFDGSNNATPGATGGASDLDDILNQMFGMGMGGMPGMGGMGGMPGGGPGMRKPKKGADEVQEYEVSLEDMYKGRSVKFASTKNVICSLCKGKGGKERAQAKTCGNCAGQGVKQVLKQIGPGLITQAMEKCVVCDGQGNFFQSKDKCKKCKGKKVTEERKVLEIYIPRGSKAGDKIVLEGEGDQIPDVEPGDIVFKLKEMGHETFRRAGNDLLANLDISLSEALCGFSRVVLKHLDGRGIELSSPAGKILRPGQILKVANEGMPFRRGDARGDLYLEVKIQFPKDNFQSGEELLKLRSLLPPAPAPVEGDPVDEVEYDPEASLDSFGAVDENGASAWADEDDDEDDEGAGAQCAAQ